MNGFLKLLNHHYFKIKIETLMLINVTTSNSEPKKGLRQNVMLTLGKKFQKDN